MPDPDDCEEDHYSLPVADGDRRNRILVRLRTHMTRVIEFAITHQTLDADDEWRNVVRADSCHHEVHVHQFDKSGNQTSRRVLRTVASVDDVDKGYDEAQEVVFEAWEDNLRRWDVGR